MKNPTEQQIEEAIGGMKLRPQPFGEVSAVGYLTRKYDSVQLFSMPCQTEEEARLQFKDLVAAELEMYP